MVSAYLVRAEMPAEPVAANLSSCCDFGFDFDWIYSLHWCFVGRHSMWRQKELHSELDAELWLVEMYDFV